MLRFRIVKASGSFGFVAVADEQLTSLSGDKGHVDGHHQPGGFGLEGKRAEDAVQRSGDVKAVNDGIEMFRNVLIFSAREEYFPAAWSHNLEQIFALGFSIIVQQAFVASHSDALTSCEDQTADIRLIVDRGVNLLNGFSSLKLA